MLKINLIEFICEDFYAVYQPMKESNQSFNKRYFHTFNIHTFNSTVDRIIELFSQHISIYCILLVGPRNIFVQHSWHTSLYKEKKSSIFDSLKGIRSDYKFDVHPHFPIMDWMDNALNTLQLKRWFWSWNIPFKTYVRFKTFT